MQISGPSRWRRGSLTGLVLGLAASSAPAQFCAIDPISPLCCPSPCPVFDPTRVAKLLADAESLSKSAVVDSQIVQTATQIGQSIGDGKATATAMSRQLPSFAGTLSSEVSAIQSGLSTNPVQALSGIEQSLFEPVGASPAATQSASRFFARIAAAQGEQAAAFATSLMRSKALPALAPQQSLLAGVAGETQQLQGDMAANSASRLALYQDAGAIHQLVSAWVAQRAIGSAVAHPNGMGGGAAAQAPIANDTIQTRSSSPSQATAAMVEQLVTLHDARVTAQTLLSAYPALQQTVAGAQLAAQFAGNAELALQQSVSAAGIGGVSLADIERALTSVDGTDWLDDRKTAAAQQAVSQVSAALAEGGPAQLTTVDGSLAIPQLRTAMAAWLDAAKQSRYWAGLAGQAEQRIASLDAALGAISTRVGVDVTGGAGEAREKRLLATLLADPAAARWTPLLAADAQDMSAQAVLSYAVKP